MNNYYKNKYPIYIYIWAYDMLKKLVIFIYRKLKKNIKK